MNALYRIIIIILLVIFASQSSLSQSTIIDSLEQELTLHPKQNSKKVDILHELAHYYRGQDINVAQEKCQEAFQLATQLNYQEGLAKNSLIQSKIHLSKSEFKDANEDALKSLKQYEQLKDDNTDGLIAVYNTLGMLGNYQNNPDTAIYYFKTAILIAKKNNHLIGESNMLNNIGVTFFNRGELDSALVYYQQSVKIDEQLGDESRKASSLNNVAIIYSIQGRYSEALEIHNQILTLRKKENNRKKIALTCQNIGILYSEMEQYEKAIVYFKEALQITRDLEDQLTTALVLNSIGSTLVELQKYEEGKQYLNEALALNSEVNNNAALIVSHNSLGKISILQFEYEEALTHFSSSLALSIASDDKRNIGLSQINLGEIYYLLNDYPTALAHALKGKKIADELQMLAPQVKVNRILSSIYEVTGEDHKALEAHKTYKILNDSLFNKENIEKITQLEYEYKYKSQLEKAKDKELKLTETVKVTTSNLERSQRNLLLGIILFLSVVVLLGGIIFYLRIKNVKERTQNIITEQKLLRSQMTPHFIFNALSVLQGIILNKEDKKAVSYLSKFSKLLRVTLENSRDQLVSLNNELIAIENYLELQNIEASTPLEYNIKIDPKINPDQYNIPAMLIQPFIENAIEHGFTDHKEVKRIDIHINEFNQDLICTVSDNGVGIETKRKTKNQDKKSLSTAITSERLTLLSNSIKKRGSIVIEDRKKYNEQGTIVTLVIPYQILDGKENIAF